MKWIFEGYTINTNKSLVSVNRVKEFLSDSYWANDRSKELTEKTIMNSLCYGVYYDEEQVGFARVVSDYATMFWIGDVYIDKNHRGKGLGKKLMGCIIETQEFKNLRGILATRDAHGFYEQFGFERVESKFMTRTIVPCGPRPRTVVNFHIWVNSAGVYLKCVFNTKATESFAVKVKDFVGVCDEIC